MSLIIEICRKTESTKNTKATKKSGQNNSFAYFRIAWRYLFLAFRAFRVFRGQLFGAVFFRKSPKAKKMAHMLFESKKD
jgi:hypothetical protein